MRGHFLLAGGRSDPSLAALREACIRAEVPVAQLLHDHDAEPAVLFRPGSREIEADGQQFIVSAGFCRYDVFSSPNGEITAGLPKSPAWFALATGLLALPEVRSFNSGQLADAGNKPGDLAIAIAAGLQVPETVLSNSRAHIEAFLGRYPDAVAKPVAGGGYCHDAAKSLEAADWQDERTALPAFLQERLSYPEYRIYRIGTEFLAFKLESRFLDYRVDPASRMVVLDDISSIRPLMNGLSKVSDMLRMDFCAFDLKTRARDGEVCFLEVNSGPMFAAHDAVSRGRLTDLMVRHLWRS